MRLFSVAALLALILLAGCATSPPAGQRSAEHEAVPGASQTTPTLPQTPGSVTPPAEESKPVTKAKPKPVPAAKQKPPLAAKAAPTVKRKPATTPTPDMVTPDASLRGKVTSYKEAFRFVVLEFPIAHLPGVGQKLFVYRNNLKIGEVKVTGPQRDDHTVADLTTGEAQAGDEVREQ